MGFNHNDVITVAKAVVEESIESEYQGDYGNYEYLYKCCFCQGSSPELKLFKHDLNCPVLIAQDLLTGNQRIKESDDG